ncbi:transglycosylase domain-containing protein [Paraclostridium bifermentans]|nr:transglycosylase domain-containing protein [Paraclostridium bifermentans]
MNLQNAIVSIEDERFYDNKGVDYMALARSVVHNAISKSTQGGSTLENATFKKSFNYYRPNYKKKT